MRNRRGLNKIWMLAIAILIALGAVGVTYGAWTDEIYIEGSLSTSGINTALTCGTCREQIGDIVIDVPDTSITCLPTLNPMVLNISVSNAMPGVDYYCNFIVDNTASGTLPVKIVSVTLAPQGLYTGITGTVPVSPVNTMLDPGDTAGGTVKISVAPDAPQPQSPAYTLTVTVARWNE